MEEHRRIVSEALGLLANHCPRLVALCYWAGTCAVAVEELCHRVSHDLDFHTKQALADVRPILAEIERSFPGRFEIVSPPDAFGSGFSGVLGLPSGNSITLEVLSNHENAPPEDLTPCTLEPAFLRVSLARYLADKIQCVAERAEARDLVDILAILKAEPAMTEKARQILRDQDALLLVERLLLWTEARLASDLAAYPDVLPGQAKLARDKLLTWLEEDRSR